MSSNLSRIQRGQIGGRPNRPDDAGGLGYCDHNGVLRQMLPNQFVEKIIQARSRAIFYFQRCEKRNQIAQFVGGEISIQTLGHDGYGTRQDIFNLVAAQ